MNYNYNPNYHYFQQDQQVLEDQQEEIEDQRVVEQQQEEIEDQQEEQELEELENQSDPFWFDDPSILIKDDRFRCYFISQAMSFEENLNALVRLSFYISVILFILFFSYKCFYLFLISLLITYFLWNSNVKRVERFEKQMNRNNQNVFRFPTQNNPLMNPLLTDIQTGEASKLPSQDEKAKKETFQFMHNNMYSDLSDLYEKNNADRQFYTVPGKTIPNDQASFAHWLYYPKPTLKEMNINSTTSW